MTISINGTSGIVNDATDLNYTGTLTGGTGVVNLGSGQVYKDASGNVGIGTASPGSFAAENDSRLVVGTGSGNTGGISLYSATTGHGDINFADGTSGAATYAGILRYDHGLNAMQFYTNGFNERARIDSSGNLLVGTTTASYTSSGRGNITLGGSGGALYAYQVGGTQKAYSYHDGTDWNFQQAASGRIYMVASGNGVYLATNGTSWTSNSDERLKDIIEPISDAANKVSTLRAVIGKYKTDDEGVRRSFLIAQDVQAVLPEAVDSSDPDKLGVQYAEVVPLLVAAIKEQQALITALTARITALEATA